MIEFLSSKTGLKDEVFMDTYKDNDKYGFVFDKKQGDSIIGKIIMDKVEFLNLITYMERLVQ